MEKYLETQYVNRAGVYLKNFKQKKSNLWAFSHDCEKTVSGKRQKTRGSIYEHGPTEPFMVRCFNCGFSKKFSTYLADISPVLYDEYRLEGYRDTQKSPESPQVHTEEIVDVNLMGLIKVSDLPSSSSVIKFLDRRCIPKKTYKLLYVAKNFYQWATKYKPEFSEIKDDSPRLILPYFNSHGKVLGFTARTFAPKVEPRYIHLRIDKSSEFIYGTERVDPSKTIYVTEGQIDSLFIDNAVAVGGAHYDSDFMRSIKTNCVIIPDTDWKRNKEVAQQLNKAIKQGFKVCFMPDTVKGKDINDIVKNGIMEKELVRLIDDNVRSGLAASLEFAINRKCKMEKQFGKNQWD